MAYTQTQVLQQMSYLLGEQSIPTSGIEDRKAFIQASLDRIARLYDWSEFKAIATVTMTSDGQNYNGSLPTDAGESPNLDVRVTNSGTGDDYIYTQIPYEEKDNYSASDYKYWLTGSTDGYTISTKATQGTVSVRYLQESPTINASISTTFPSSMVIARGALVYYKQAENPLADVAQDEAFFEKELEEVISRQNRNKPVGRAKSIQEIHGQYTGRI